MNLPAEFMIKEFCRVFGYETYEEYYTEWMEEIELTPTKMFPVINPSATIGLAYLPEFYKEYGEGNWAEYDILDVPKEKDLSDFIFQDNLYGCSFLRIVIEGFFRNYNSIELATIMNSICFKMNDEWAIVIGERLVPDDWKFNEDGVWFFKAEEYEEDNETCVRMINTEWVDWNNNSAQLNMKRICKESYYFTIYKEELGSMMLL